MKIIISNQSKTPIYEQIKDQIKEGIFSGELGEDDQLPSIRQLAKDLRISVITTTRAYNDLQEEGFIAIVQGKGCFVLPRNKELAKENALAKVEEGLVSVIEVAKSGNISKAELLKTMKIFMEEEDYE